LKHIGLINEILFVHPKDMQDGKIAVGPDDITTNLPYVPTVYRAFDHHYSEILRNPGVKENHIIHPDAPSAARVVYEYFGGNKNFPKSWDEMMCAVDKGDSAQYNRDEILNPEKWDLLNFLMDARTGLGRYRNFRISNYQLMMELIDCCSTQTIDEIMNHPDVRERVNFYFEHTEKCKEQISHCSVVYQNLVVLDLRNEDQIFAGNRFLIYALYPQQNISIHILWGLKNQNTVFATGKSIINRSSHTNVGSLMLEFGGGGHENAGTCQVENSKASEVLAHLIARINIDW
jgi:nanoRNase/pAp phosphatase (c-di-AMP/oligoRNAs hydrolase)